MELTQIEKRLIEIIRELKPFEHVDIQKDKSGRLESYVIHRSQKVIIDSVNTDGII